MLCWLTVMRISNWRSDVIKKEQFYIYYFKPEYNILTKAESSLHFKHSK